jgi:starch synthase
LRIAHLSAEVAPFAKTGGLGDVVGSLPKFQAAAGHEVDVWMPLYRQVREWLGVRGISPEWVTDPIHFDLGYRHWQVGLLRTYLPGSSVPVYLIGCDEFFDRPHIYTPGPSGEDGLLKYAVFVRGVLEAMRRLRRVPDVLHAHDWHMTLAPMALAWDWPPDWHFSRTLSVLTIHNLAYQGVFGRGEFTKLGLPPLSFSQLEWNNDINLMKGGILSAHVLTAVSPNFAREIQTAEGGFGLDPVVRMRSGDTIGIVNGIDRHVWNPAVDPKIPVNYDIHRLRRKLENRRALLSFAGMDRSDPSFVVGIVGRLTEQKGIDLLFPVLGNLINAGIRFVLLGSGEDRLEQQIRNTSARAVGRFWGYVGFNEELSHLVEAGADAFLMPSRFEPCGLNQLYSLAYGTPPIVRRVGGLADTVVGFDGGNSDWANGFSFDAPTPWALHEAVRWAGHCYRDPFLWTHLVRNGMNLDWSWERSADQYVEVYRRGRASKGWDSL